MFAARRKAPAGSIFEEHITSHLSQSADVALFDFAGRYIAFQVNPSSWQRYLCANRLEICETIDHRVTLPLPTINHEVNRLFSQPP